MLPVQPPEMFIVQPIKACLLQFQVLLPEPILFHTRRVIIRKKTQAVAALTLVYSVQLIKPQPIRLMLLIIQLARILRVRLGEVWMGTVIIVEIMESIKPPPRCLMPEMLEYCLWYQPEIQAQANQL